MKKLIKLCAFVVIIAFIASCEKTEQPAVDKFAAYNAEKEQIMAYVEKNNLDNYSTTINTKLTEAERLTYVKDIPSNNNEPDINLDEKTEMYLKENHIGENNLKAGGEYGAVHLIRLPWTENSFIYYGYSQYTSAIPYIDIISDRYVTDMDGRWAMYHNYKYAYNSNKVTDINQFNSIWGLLTAYGDHWFSFSDGSYVNIFSSASYDFYPGS